MQTTDLVNGLQELVTRRGDLVRELAEVDAALHQARVTLGRVAGQVRLGDYQVAVTECRG